MWLALVGAALLAAIYVVLPAATGLDDAWATLRSGSKSWLLPAALAEAASFAGWVLLLRTILVCEGADVGWALSARITLAGVAATRLLATAGAGGIALTAWALRRLGLTTRRAAGVIATLLVALYAVYLLAIAAAGVGLRTGLLPGRAAISLTLVPAGLAALAMLAVVLLAALSRVPTRPAGKGPMRWLRAMGTGPLLLGSGLRRTARLVRERNVGLAGAVAWWAFDLLALWCSFRAFGVSPPLGALAMGYLLGQLGNLLPLPGGVGGIDGAMIGSFIALGIGASAAVVAVLAYRSLSFWLPTLPGIAAYMGLRRDLDGVTASSSEAARTGSARSRRLIQR
jgi:putative heme transporter